MEALWSIMAVIGKLPRYASKGFCAGYGCYNSQMNDNKLYRKSNDPGPMYCHLCWTKTFAEGKERPR